MNNCENDCNKLLIRSSHIGKIIDNELMPRYNETRHGTPERNKLHNEYIELDIERDRLRNEHESCVKKCRETKGGSGSKRKTKTRNHRHRRANSKKTKKTVLACVAIKLKCFTNIEAFQLSLLLNTYWNVICH